MYCPQCATENIENASYCRGCGANIGLVSQALTGNLPAADGEEVEDASYSRRRRRRGQGQPSIEKGIKNIFMGFAFMLVAFAARKYGAAGAWSFWLLIPAFAMLGGGVAELVRFRMSNSPQLPAAPGVAALPVAPTHAGALPRRNTAELIPQPPSVTEATTRHLETPVESKPKNV